MHGFLAACLIVALFGGCLQDPVSASDVSVRRLMAPHTCDAPEREMVFLGYLSWRKFLHEHNACQDGEKRPPVHFGREFVVGVVADMQGGCEFRAPQILGVTLEGGVYEVTYTIPEAQPRSEGACPAVSLQPGIFVALGRLTSGVSVHFNEV